MFQVRPVKGDRLTRLHFILDATRFERVERLSAKRMLEYVAMGLRVKKEIKKLDPTFGTYLANFNPLPAITTYFQQVDEFRKSLRKELSNGKRGGDVR